jgi:hypothetical protein
MQIRKNKNASDKLAFLYNFDMPCAQGAAGQV